MKPVRDYGITAPSTAPVMEWRLPTAEQLAEHFRRTNNLEGMWETIRNARAHPEFKIDQVAYYRRGIPMIIKLDPIVFQETYTDFANFYGIPWGVIAMYLDVPREQAKAGEDALWESVLSPLNAMLPDAFEILKPADLPGYFNASFTEPKGTYWLSYVEPMLPGPPASGGSGGS
jgi:hypothetical protein